MEEFAMRWSHASEAELCPTVEQHVYVPITSEKARQVDDNGNTLSEFLLPMNPPLRKTVPSAPDLQTLLRHESQQEAQRTSVELKSPNCDGTCKYGDPETCCCFYDTIIKLDDPQHSVEAVKTQKAIRSLSIYKIAGILVFIVIMVVILLLFVVPP